MLQLQCANCKQALQVPDSSAGKTIRCPRCSQTMVMPAEPTADIRNATTTPDVTGLGNVVQEYQPRRTEARHLARQFRADRASSPGDENDLVLQLFADRLHIKRHRRTAKQIFRIDIPE